MQTCAVHANESAIVKTGPLGMSSTAVEANLISFFKHELFEH
jgi:hypothetical protein